MSRIALGNILFGFVIIIFCSLGGFFLATDAEKYFQIDKTLLVTWQYTLFKSAHGHCNLFGILHILMGLTLPYSHLKSHYHIAQSFGLALGTLTMGVLMVIRGLHGIPSSAYDSMGITIGTFLSLAVGALMLHSFGIAKKLVRI